MICTFLLKSSMNIEQPPGPPPSYPHASTCVSLYVGLHISHISAWKLRSTRCRIVTSEPARWWWQTVLLVKVYICTYIDLAAGEVQDVLIVQLWRCGCMGVKRLLCCAIHGNILKIIGGRGEGPTGGGRKKELWFSWPKGRTLGLRVSHCRGMRVLHLAPLLWKIACRHHSEDIVYICNQTAQFLTVSSEPRGSGSGSRPFLLAFVLQLRLCR